MRISMKPIPLLLATMTVLALSAADACSAASLNRLFLTTAERNRLDQLRDSGLEDDPILTDGAAPVAKPTDQFILNGFVKRSSGKNTAWINSQPQNESTHTEGILVLGRNAKSPAMSVQLPSGKKIRLKAGQTFDIDKGKLHEVYDNEPAPQAKTPAAP